ncbi:MAG: hypothetical protein ACXAEL_10400 [Candidatus Hodarchaeales archaeon]|jgi:hypothetical protein
MVAAKRVRLQSFALVLTIFCLLTGFSAPSTGLSLVNQPPSAVDPYWGTGFMFESADKALLRRIALMQPTEISQTHVYYDVSTLSNSRSQPINTTETASFSFEVSDLLRNLNRANQSQLLSNTTRTLLNAAIAELEGHSRLFSTKTTHTSLTVDREIFAKSILFLWDPDDSIRQAIGMWQQGKRSSGQPFTGDEVLVQLQVGYFQEAFQGSVTSFVQWTLEDDTNATATHEFMNHVLRNPLFRRLLQLRGIPVRQLDFLFGPSVTTIEGSGSRIVPTFDILLLRLEELLLDTTNNTVKATSFKTTLQETHFAGMFAWNDSNGDGQVDQWLAENDSQGYASGSSTSSSSAPRLPMIGRDSELSQRFDFLNVESTSFSQTTSDNEGIQFGMYLSNVSGRFVPIAERADVALLARPATAVAERLSSLNMTFQFSPNTTTREAALKLSYAFGEWNDTAPLENLGLTLLYVTSFTTFRAESRVQVGSETFDPDSVQSQQASRIHFQGSNNDEWGFVDLDSEQYLWNGAQNHSVLGTVVPLGYAEVTMSSSEQGGRIIREMRQSTVARSTVLYGVTYPTWDGKSIVHDPTFSVYSNPPSIVPSEVAEEIKTILQPGSIGLFMLATIGIVVIVAYNRIKD